MADASTIVLKGITDDVEVVESADVDICEDTPANDSATTCVEGLDIKAEATVDAVNSDGKTVTGDVKIAFVGKHVN